MQMTHWNPSRFVVGIVLIIAAVLMLVFARGEYATAGIVAIAVLGLISIATARRR
jgi:hypothetical protein